ncbi:hypothetical protein I6A60_03560 [Frankia sp. AgB1.9]|uniref:hypothetical protein n=1 Tax=unclassified Frankia TaxID=2632575 RepID=UPI0019316A86|nr:MULTISPECIES: hypothetical protein [unclassified Frankia]MBL7491945.1 hypothetical protein [Frankia sp. AgW1.1]MBL7546960.1 hypothetical protein [Frankia sp. AgB1.9]MBL7620607.1 hypothetical protein [Frankia sp. AgB1.8]
MALWNPSRRAGGPTAVDPPFREPEADQPTATGLLAADDYGDAIDSPPTRSLCAAVHLSNPLTDLVLSRTVRERHRAWAPCYSVNLPAVLQHALASRRRRRTRDGVLLLLLVGPPTDVLVDLDLRFGAGVTLVSAVLVVGAVVVGRAALRRWRGDKPVTVRRVLGLLWRQISSEKGALALVVLLAVVAGVAVLLVRGGASMPWADLLVLAGGLVVAWLTVVADLSIGAGKAAALLDRTKNPFDLARPLPGWILDRARDTGAANVIIYGNKRKKDPFVGSGDRLGGFPIVVDVTRGKESGDGERATPEPIDVTALHRFLRTSAASVKIPGLWCGHRLYVDGMAVGGYLDLVPERAHPSVTELPHDRLLAALYHPQPKRRAYLCLQLTGWDGELVVTMFVRAELSANLLMIEVSAHGLLPVDESWLGDVAGLAGARERAWDIVRAASRQTLGSLLGSPRRCVGELVKELRHQRQSARDARSIRRLRRFDYGLAYSLREIVAREEHRYYNSRIDEQGQVARLQDQLLRALEEFLDARGVDTSDLTDRRRTVVNNITSYLFGDVVGDNVAIGTNSRAGDGRERPPGAGGNNSPSGGRRPGGPAGPDKPKDGTTGS